MIEVQSVNKQADEIIRYQSIKDVNEESGSNQGPKIEVSNTDGSGSGLNASTDKQDNLLDSVQAYRQSKQGSV